MKQLKGDKGGREEGTPEERRSGRGRKGTGGKGERRQRRREAGKREHRRKGSMEEETKEKWKKGRGRGFFSHLTSDVSHLTSDVSPFFHLSPFTFHHKKVPLDWRDKFFETIHQLVIFSLVSDWTVCLKTTGLKLFNGLDAVFHWMDFNFSMDGFQVFKVWVRFFKGLD